MNRNHMTWALVFALLLGLLGAGGFFTPQSAAAHPQFVGGQAALRPDPLGGATAFPKLAQPTAVDVMLDWTPNTNHSGLYIALAKGYYAEAGLNVTIQPAGDVAVDQVVASGRAQFGISYQEGLTYSRAAGLPIVSIAAIINSNTSGFASLADKKPLKTPADLIGLRYGGFGSAIELPIINALIACSGKTGTVEQIDIGFAEPFPLMERDRIDFVWLFYAWDGIRAQQRGLKLDILMLRDYPDCVPDYYTPVLTTSEQMISERADVVAAFVAATARGYADAIKNPAEAAEILLAAAPDLDADLVKASAEWLAAEYQGKAKQWGWQELTTWQKFTEFMVKSGALQTAIDPEKAFTNAFLPKP
jgi:ABC-type nitrate/sulfonate/bicarbonate transport system substrate-binding protein